MGSACPSRSSLCRVLFLACIACAMTFAVRAQQGDSDIVKRIDDSRDLQEQSLRGYVRDETYAVFRGQDASPAARMVVRVSYKQGGGKTFRTLSEEGSKAIRELVIRRFLDEQHELSGASSRREILVTSANYVFTNRMDTSIGGHEAFRFDIAPHVRGPHVLEGQAWFDRASYQLVRITGRPAESPSFWTGRPVLTRDYTEVEGFELPSHLEAEAHSPFFGKTTVTIQYSNYHVEH